MNKTIITLAVIIVVGIGIYFVVSNNSSSGAQNAPASATQSSTASTPTAPVSNATATPAPASVTVSIKNFSFNPSTLTVKTGTKVTWVNNDTVPHTVTSDSGNLLNSPTLSPGQSFSLTLTSAGSVGYHCSIHPMMKGTVIVEN